MRWRSRISPGQDTEEAYVRWFRERFPDLRVVVTLGRRGAMYIDRDQVIRHPAYNTTIVDTTAAGLMYSPASSWQARRRAVRWRRPCRSLPRQRASVYPVMEQLLRLPP